MINLQKLITNMGESLPISANIEPYAVQDGEVTDITASGHINNFSGRLELHLNIKGAYHSFCSRCMSDLTAPIELTLDDRLVREPSEQDYILLENDYFNITSYVHEEISLHLPIRVLCREGCRGLCPTCGVNLNEKQCDCKPDEIDSRFDKLKKLLDKKEE